MSRNLLSVFVVCLCSGIAFASNCPNPKVSVTSFSTQDATILTQVAHIGEFSLNCGNGEQPHLFARFPCGKVVPVASTGNGKYQVSWTEEPKKSRGGKVYVNLFNEEGFGNLRKAERDGDKVDKVKSLVDINVATTGAYKGPWVKAELLAALAVAGIAYFAFTAKNKVQG